MTSPPQTRLEAASTAPRDRTRLNCGSNFSSFSSPFERFLAAHESATGCKAIRTNKGARFTCAVCGTKSLKGAGAEGDNRTMLAHFFCGHTVQENLAAVGMVMGDLFVKRDLRNMSPAERSHLRQAGMLPKWKAALEVFAREATVILFAGNQLADNQSLNDADLTRLRLACLRVFDCREVLTP